MPESWTPAAVRRHRAAAQLLAGGRAGSVLDVVHRVVGVQAQDVRFARLAIRARSTGLSRADVDAVTQAGTAVRTWLMRGTLHMVTAADVRWLLRIFGPRNAAAGSRRRRQLGLDDRLCAESLAALRDILGGSAPLQRDALVARLAGAGIVLDPRSQAPAHLLAHAAANGVVCRGPDGPGDRPTWKLLDAVVPPDAASDPILDRVSGGSAEAGDEDLARLAIRYVAGHGAAGAEDLAAWGGLPVAVARRAIAVAGDRLEPVRATGGDLVRLPAGGRAAGVGGVRLLGHLDGYLLGYRDRRLSVPVEHDRRLQRGGGFVLPSVVVDGRVVATWSAERGTGGTLVDVRPLQEPIPRSRRGALEAEVADLGRFLGVPHRLR